MNGRFVLGVLLALVLIAGAIGVGVYAYNAGVAQGMIASGKIVVPSTDVVPAPYTGGHFFYRPYGFHAFGLLGCLVPLLFFFLFFGLIRAFVWRGHWGWGGMHHRHWDKETIPPMVEEWHRKMHEVEKVAK